MLAYQRRQRTHEVALLALMALSVALSSCGEGAAVAASLQFSLSAAPSLAVKAGDEQPTPLLITVAHIISTPFTVPIALTLDHPPLGVHAQDATVGIGQSSTTLNVYVDSTYAGAATTVLTVKGTALQVSTQKVDVTLQITRKATSTANVVASTTGVITEGPREITVLPIETVSSTTCCHVFLKTVKTLLAFQRVK